MHLSLFSFHNPPLMEPASSRSLVEEREKLYNTLCNKYVEHLLAVLR